MTEEEFKNKVEQEQLRHDRELRALIKERLNTMARCKVGDRIEDRSGCAIIVESIKNGSYSGRYNKPIPCYYGTLLTKKGEPRKDGMARTIFDEHLVKVNGQTIE